MQTKKFIFSLLVLLGICGSMTAQNNYKVLEVHKDGKVTHTLKLSDIDSLTVKTIGDDDLNGHEYVDLGLPSGTLWATTNVGAASPADCGDYFAWGEISPKETYDYSTYKWCNGSSYNTLTKYNTDSFYGSIVDQKLVLETSDDVATADWGSEWCMPTAEEMKELADSNNCTWTWTKRTNSKGETVNGYEVKSNANGNSIFLPATGYCNDASSYKTDIEGHYWSLSIHSYDDSVYPYYAHYLKFTPDYHDANSGIDRHYGLSVRPVRATTR